MVDFAAEASYENAARRLYEHHGVEIHPSTIRRKTMNIACKAAELISRNDVTETSSSQTFTKPCETVVLEMDGVMVPIANLDGKNSDRRKNRTTQWMEMKVGAVEDPVSGNRLYAASFQDVDSLGDQLTNRICQLKPAEETYVHGVGDGALWIPEQGERIAGRHYHHLIDFYHLSEYLHAAYEGDAQACLKVTRCQEEMKSGKMNKVRRRLQRHLKLTTDSEKVINCLRYLKNRPGQFDYPRALKNELPIGSGMIESTNRSLIQKRIKLPGAWWQIENVAKMASLRVLRANNEWEKLWVLAA